MSGANPHAGTDDPHDSEPATAGAPLEAAAVAVVMVHGRGATAEGILGLREELELPDDAAVAYLAPRAHSNTWYPHSFLEPVERNEPGRSSGLRAIDRLVDRATDAGVPADRVLLVGFSQGACLASEYVARHPRRYGGLVVLSGGLIGDELDDYEGDLDGTPVFLGCSDRDPHIPVERVHATRDALSAMGADVTERIYEGMGHGVNADELDHASRMVRDLLG